MSDRLQWHKFSWTAWETDDGLALCSMGAQGFWMRLLCMAAKEGGYVVLKGKKPATAANLAYLHRQSVEDVEKWLTELEENEVFSRDGQGRIYSRRMMRDAKIAKRNQQNGKKGGNPSLRKDGENPAWDNPSGAEGVKAEKETESEEETDTPKPPQGAEGEDGDLFGDEPEQPDEVRLAFDAWNVVAKRHGLPIAEDLTDKRKKAIKNRLKGGGLPRWTRALDAVQASGFCLGQHRPRDPEDKPFKASLDFVCQASSFQKLIEGNYGQDVKAAPGAQIATLAPKFNGPPALRASVVAATSEAFALNYIDQATWRAEDRTLIAANGFAAKQIERNLRTWLVTSKVRVEVAGQLAGAAA